MASAVIRVLSVVAALAVPGVLQAQDGPQSLETMPLVIETAAGGRHAFTVEIADDAEEQRIGLMFRKEMAADYGMLFTYWSPRPASFWMKNTYLPLDIVFIQADGRIANIAADTEPLSLASIPSKGRVLAILELNAGTAAKLEIAPGDRVSHPVFGNWATARP